ncbi:hypothetical protein ACGFJ7_39505 [Actinoplanes sp. NPDC048988]|uniref:hypothetical protein n=1 Tax=Actinoplanes sp. NPDC048988 TaxID=3363901 RepID=UPI00371D62DB
MTGTPADVARYFYWSQRRIDRIAEDNRITVQRTGSTKMKSPAGPFLPGVEVDRPRPAMSRPEIADRIERHLAGVTVRDFVTPPPVRFAAGLGTLSFAEFVNFGKRENIVSIFTDSTASDGTHVAVGMFGSKDNLADIIAGAQTTDTGWSSSAANHIFGFISSFGRTVASGSDREEIAREAINLLTHQGGGIGEGEKRGFTYGHIGEHGEWLMEAYLDVEIDYPPYDRIVVGAPLWVRTASPQALVLYQDGPPEPAPRRRSWWRRRPG